MVSSLLPQMRVWLVGEPAPISSWPPGGFKPGMLFLTCSCNPAVCDRWGKRICSCEDWGQRWTWTMMLWLLNVIKTLKFHLNTCYWMLNAVFLWRQASSSCSLLLFHCLPADEVNHRDALLQWWDEGWGRLEDFTGNETSRRQTVNRCWPCVQRKGCEITEHGPGPPRSRLGICQCACFHCVCVQTWRLTVRDRVRLKSFEIPAFLWGILSVIYLSWALWACTLNYRAELKDAYSQSRWEWLTRYTEIFLPFSYLSVFWIQISVWSFIYTRHHVYLFFLEPTKWKKQHQRNLCKCPGVKSRHQKWILHLTAAGQTAFFLPHIFGFSDSLFKVNSHKCQSGLGWWNAKPFGSGFNAAFELKLWQKLKLAFKPQIGFRILNQFWVIVSNILL